MSFAKGERRENPPPPHSPLLCAHRPHKTTQGQGTEEEEEEEEAGKKERDETKQGFVRGGERKSRLLPPSSVAVQASERPPFVICHFPPPLLPLPLFPFSSHRKMQKTRTENCQCKRSNDKSFLRSELIGEFLARLLTASINASSCCPNA